MAKNFALIGVAGYVAPRHLRAIRETRNTLVAALDKAESVGIMDSYFPDADFFLEFERFDRHVEKLRRMGEDRRVDFVSICSPNYLHDAHIRFALRVGADAICEKPLVVNPWNIDALRVLERESGKTVHNILQLRHHPTIAALKDRVAADPKDRKFDIDLTYITSRGKWYLNTWKGDVNKSGGVATNIGIHFFDMLAWIFGPVQNSVVHVLDAEKAAGFLELEKARVRWYLSIDRNDLPKASVAAGRTTFRSIRIDDEEVEFSDGFNELHIVSYREILAGRGFGMEDARASIELAHAIRNAKPTGFRGDYHPILWEVVNG